MSGDVIRTEDECSACMFGARCEKHPSKYEMCIWPTRGIHWPGVIFVTSVVWLPLLVWVLEHVK